MLPARRFGDHARSRHPRNPMTAPPASAEATGEMFRRVLGILIILLFALASLWILLPFLTAIIWAATIATSTWPFLVWLQGRLGGRRGLATAVITVGMLVVFFVPVLIAIGAIVGNADDLMRWGREITASGLPGAPAWLDGVPVLGHRLAQKWQDLAQLSPDELALRVAPHLRSAASWLLAKAGGLALLTLQFLLTAAVTAVFYMTGEHAAARLAAVARRLAGRQGEELVDLAGKSVRGVALGVVGTALIQTAISAIGMLATGVPGAGVLAGAVALLCLAQVGPALVLFPAVGWLYWTGHPTTGTILLVISVFAVTIDNVIRPLLIKKGADLPFLLVFSGVIGGMLAAGIIGIFVGPVILAVTWTLLQAWVAEPDAQAA
jgi:predicted PurR-regulated permease PerM